MSEVQETVNLEHLLMNIPLPEDPLPTAEEIAGAKAAAAATAHSTCSAAVPGAAQPPVKGLGGAGLNLKRKGGGKAGTSSTISAATAPPALLSRQCPPPAVEPAGGVGGRAGAVPSSNLCSNQATAAAAAPTPPAGSTAGPTGPPAAAEAVAVAAAATAPSGAGGQAAAPAQRTEAGVTGVATPEGGPLLVKGSAGVRSFRMVLSPEEEGSSDWETASAEEIKPADAAESARSDARGGSSSSSWGNGISSVLEDFVDPSTLAFCGVVLGACAGALLVLSASVWLRSRQ